MNSPRYAVPASYEMGTRPGSLSRLCVDFRLLQAGQSVSAKTSLLTDEFSLRTKVPSPPYEEAER